MNSMPICFFDELKRWIQVPDIYRLFATGDALLQRCLIQSVDEIHLTRDNATRKFTSSTVPSFLGQFSRLKKITIDKSVEHNDFFYCAYLMRNLLSLKLTCKNQKDKFFKDMLQMLQKFSPQMQILQINTKLLMDWTNSHRRLYSTISVYSVIWHDFKMLHTLRLSEVLIEDFDPAILPRKLVNFEAHVIFGCQYYIPSDYIDLDRLKCLPRLTLDGECSKFPSSLLTLSIIEHIDIDHNIEKAYMCPLSIIFRSAPSTLQYFKYDLRDEAWCAYSEVFYYRDEYAHEWVPYLPSSLLHLEIATRYGPDETRLENKDDLLFPLECLPKNLSFLSLPTQPLVSQSQSYSLPNLSHIKFDWFRLEKWLNVKIAPFAIVENLNTDDGCLDQCKSHLKQLTPISLNYEDDLVLIEMVPSFPNSLKTISVFIDDEVKIDEEAQFSLFTRFTHCDTMDIVYNKDVLASNWFVTPPNLTFLGLGSDEIDFDLWRSLPKTLKELWIKTEGSKLISHHCAEMVLPETLEELSITVNQPTEAHFSWPPTNCLPASLRRLYTDIEGAKVNADSLLKLPPRLEKWCIRNMHTTICANDVHEKLGLGSLGLKITVHCGKTKPFNITTDCVKIKYK